jgi:6-pyruvoyl-tetrahydropterin synthase
MTHQTIAVKHNIEVAHRLYELPGKCEQIHGHSMWVTMHLDGVMNDKGILAGIEYGDLKKLFRGYLDSEYDHRLLLNATDPFAHPLFQMQRNEEGEFDLSGGQVFLPGLQTFVGDPTTENIARWITEYMHTELLGNNDLFYIRTEVWETNVNMASYGRSMIR